MQLSDELVVQAFHRNASAGGAKLAAEASGWLRVGAGEAHAAEQEQRGAAQHSEMDEKRQLSEECEKCSPLQIREPGKKQVSNGPD